MSACAVVAEPQLTSPELALVDPALAAELRRELRPSEGIWHLPRARVEAILVEIEASVLEEPMVPDAPRPCRTGRRPRPRVRRGGRRRRGTGRDRSERAELSLPGAARAGIRRRECDRCCASTDTRAPHRAGVGLRAKAPPPLHHRVGGKRGLCARDSCTRPSAAGGRRPDPARLLSPAETRLKAGQA